MMVNAWWMHTLWVLAAGVVGFGVTAVTAGWLKLKREWVVLVYLLVAGAFLYAYFSWGQIDLLEQLRQRWLMGLAGAVVVGLIAVRNVASQPATPRSHGARFAFDLLWNGVVYGLLDGVFLSVMPLLASWQAFSLLGWMGSPWGTLGACLVGLLASTYVTKAYHVRYPEFRGSEVGMPILGNYIMTLGYIVTRNPLTAALSHATMHVAAVVQGMEATIQLPPHY